MGRHATDSKRQQRLRFKTVVHPLGIGVDDVVRQRRFRDSIRLSTQQLPAPELETDEGSQVEQVGVGYGLTDRFTERSRLSGISDRQLDLLNHPGHRSC